MPLREVVHGAGSRWTIEESFQTGKSLAGLDKHQIRRLFLVLVVEPAAHQPARAPGRTGDDASNTAPEPALTGARRPPDDGHSDLTLEH